MVGSVLTEKGEKMQDREMSREEAIKRLEEGAPFSELYDPRWEDALALAIKALKDEPAVRCKDCKYFYYNKAYNIQGFPIMGNSVCDKWASGCRTDENGYCFLGERREDAN